MVIEGVGNPLVISLTGSLDLVDLNEVSGSDWSININIWSAQALACSQPIAIDNPGVSLI